MFTATPYLGVPLDDLVHVLKWVQPSWDKLKNKRLLITGATGFIGKWMLATFLYANDQLKLSAQVRLVSRTPEKFLAEFPKLRERPDITWTKSDVRYINGEAGEGCSYAIHAATDVVAANNNKDLLDTCIAGTQRVIDSLSGQSRLLLLSSGAVYGPATGAFEGIPETSLTAPDPLLPSSAYGEGKRMSELLCSMAAAQQHHFEAVIARCFAFVGPHLPLDKHFAIGNFIQSASRSEDIIIQGDGTPLRTYLYAADLAHWLWALLLEAPASRAYNVGGSEPISIRDLAERVNCVLGGRGRVIVRKQPDSSRAPQTYVPDISRIRSELSLAPSVGLSEAIVRTAHWNNSNL